MVPQDSAEAAASLLTETAQASLGRSAYGDWRSIANADAISLSFGFPTPEVFPTDALAGSVRATLEEEGDRVLQYGGGRYNDQLTTCITERCRNRGINLEEDDVLVMNGAIHALDATCRAFVEPGDVLALERPTFMGAFGVCWNVGAKLLEIPLDEQGMDTESFANELHQRRTQGQPLPSLVYTIPTFQNPSGTTMAPDRREHLLALAEEYDFVIIEDDAYGELRYDGKATPPLKALDNTGRVIYIGSFSKTIAPGIRLGWIVAPSTAKAAIDALSPGGSNTFTRSVIGHYCSDGKFDPNLTSMKSAYKRRRDQMLESLERHMPPGTEWTTPEGGFFIWVTAPEGVDMDDLLTPAIDAGVTFLPGSMFYATDGGARSCRLSFSFASPEEIDRGIARLATTVDDHC